MKEHDFDAAEQGGYDEDAVGFENVPNPMQVGEPEKEEPVEQESEPKKHLKIEIDSIDKMIGALKYSTIKLDEAMDKVHKKQDLPQILDEISKIKAIDVSKYSEQLQSTINNFDISSIEKKIDEKFEKSMNKNFSNLIQASQKYEKYAEVFDNEEIYNTFSQIENLEKFMKNFKFKSIVFTSLFSFFIAFLISFFAINMMVESRVEEELKATQNPILYFFNTLNKNEVLVAEDGKIKQLQIKSPKIQIMTGADGVKYLEVQK